MILLICYKCINSDTSKELKYIIYQLQNKYFKTDIPKILNDEFKIDKE